MLDYRRYPRLGQERGATTCARGKPTLPLIRVMETGTPEQSELIREAIKTGQADFASNWPRPSRVTDARRMRARTPKQVELARQALSAFPVSFIKNLC